jgi:hypothetical protein
MKTKTLLILAGVGAAGYYLMKGGAAAATTAAQQAAVAQALTTFKPKLAGQSTGAGVLQSPSTSGVAPVATTVGPGSLSGTCFSAKRGLGSLG